MKVTDLGEYEAILCTTEEECNKILDLMHEAGLKWSNGQSYKEERNMSNLRIGQCYHPKNGTYPGKGYCLSEGYKLYNASEFIDSKYKMGDKVVSEEGGSNFVDFYNKVGDIYSYKMGDKVVHEGEISYFVKLSDKDICIVERNYGWGRCDDIPKNYISKLKDKYFFTSVDAITPYVGQPVEEQQEVKEEGVYYDCELQINQPQSIKDETVTIRREIDCRVNITTTTPINIMRFRI